MSVLESLGVADPARWAFSLLVVRATVVVLLAWAAMAALRRASASARHAALAFTVLALLALPPLSLFLPAWEVGVLPARAPSEPRRFSFAVERGKTAPSTRPSVVTPGARVEDQATVLKPEPERSRRDAPSLWSSLWAQSLASLFLLVWAAGVAAGLTQLALATFLVRRTARGASAIDDPEWLAYLDEASTHLGLVRPVRLLSSPAAVVPVVYGLRQGVVLLPTDAAEWPEDRRRAFLLHELAHVSRHDCLTQTLGHIARLLYWPNPLAWWLVRRMRAEAERACDDRVLSSGTSASDYAAHLLEAARHLKRAERPLAVLAVVERSRLEDRLLALLDPGLRRGSLTRRSLGFGVASSLLLVASIATLQPVAGAVAPSPAAKSKPERRSSESPLAVSRVETQQSPVRETRSEPPVGNAGAGVVPPAPPTARATNSEPVPVPDSSRAVSVPETTPSAEIVVARQPGGTDQSPASAAPVPEAPPTTVPVIRISTEIVQIDAVVTDKAGRHIVDLQPSDFEVFESGRRQRVSHLVYVKTGQGPTTGGPAALAAVPQTAAPRTVLLVVDDLGLSLDSMDRTRRLLSTFAQNELEPNDRVAILKTSEPGVRGVIMNADAHALRTTAEGLRLNLWSRSFYPAESGQTDDRMRQFLLAIDSISALKGMIDALRAVSGRKAVIFFSEGFATAASQDQDRLLRLYTQRPLDGLYGDQGIRAALNSLTDLANRASVVIYTLDPTGLTAGAGAVDEENMMSTNVPGASSGSSEDSRGGPGRGDPTAVTLARQRALFRTGQQDSLIQLADETGGLAVYNRNDMGEGLGRILADHAGYYLIGYEPEAVTFSASPGNVPFHKVKVEVKRRGLKVRSRKGFYGVPDEMIAKAAPPPSS